MGPLFFRAENDVPPPPESRASKPLQWGRSFSERRTAVGRVPGRRRPGFNGAALFQSGEPSASCACWEVTCASMGPLFFRAENPAAAAALAAAVRCFNGAALFQSGERTGLGGHRELVAASMGPLFFRAENLMGLPVVPRTPALQWGRSFSERRTNPPRPSPAPAITLQWGRSFSERRTLARLLNLRLHFLLQWGRSFSERRTIGLRGGGICDFAASMGPLFFRAENLPARRSTPSRRSRCFNGAALFQSGERDCRCIT